MAIEKMNVYIVTKDKVQVAKKEGKWFKDLFLPLFKSNKDPLGKQPKLDDYWKEIRDCLVGKKKNKNLKVIKHKDLKFIAFNVKHGTILAFATGNEKSDSLNDIYKIAQEKSEGMTYEKFLKLSKATDSPAVLDKYNSLVQEGITDKQAKEWGYKNIEDLVKNGCNSEDSDVDHPYMNASPMGTIIDISNWDIKKWANEMIEKIKPLVKDEDITGVYEDATEMKISSTNDRYFGEYLIATFLEFYVRDANGQEDDASFGDIVEYYGNKEVIDNQHKIEEEIAAYFIKDSLMFKSNKKSLQKSSDSKLSKKKVLYSDILDWLAEHDQAWTDYCEHFGLSEEGEGHYITPDDTVGWISEHDLLYSDFLNRYNLDSDYVENTNAEDYIKDDIKKENKIDIIAPSGSGKGVNLLDTDEDGPVMAYEENKSESLAEVEHDFITGLINYQDAVDTILDMGEANSESDAQAIVDAWELKNKKDTGKADKVKFKIYLDKVKEPEEELKKLEHHFDYLYGDTNPGNYWDVKVDYHTGDRYTIISGYISGVNREDFEAYIREGMDDYHALLKDIDWLEPLTGKELEQCIKDALLEYNQVGQPFEQEEQFELINEEYLVDKDEWNKYWNKWVY